MPGEVKYLTQVYTSGNGEAGIDTSCQALGPILFHTFF